MVYFQATFYSHAVCTSSFGLKSDVKPQPISGVRVICCAFFFLTLVGVSSQELPPGCGPPCPSLAGIFGWDMDEEELNTARDGEEHLQTSQASRRLTAQSTASPKELASHVQVRSSCMRCDGVLIRNASITRRSDWYVDVYIQRFYYFPRLLCSLSAWCCVVRIRLPAC